ncbi:MAG: glycerate kinase [Saprospiraceae bacterium]|nr:glycerate kinase [Saprospiraceae bacterium]
MRILIAADSFKDALPAQEVCRAIAAGLRRRSPAMHLIEFPLADGGEGTFEVLSHHLGLEKKEAEAVDPLFRSLRAPFGYGAAEGVALVEMAKASGLPLLRPDERDPLKTTTFGTGMLLSDAVAAGARRIVLAIGGSATNDAGMGMAAALGWQFLDKAGNGLSPVGASLEAVDRIVPPENGAFPPTDLICDVDNPLFGSRGAAHVYGRQKGADDNAVERLDRGLRHFSAKVEQALGKPGLSETPGAGAAGGLGFGAMAFLNAGLQRGIELVMDLTRFDEALAAADLIITGEGMIDGQTLHGKLIHGVCRRAARRQTPVIALCGRLEATPEQIRSIGLKAAYSINDAPAPLPELLARTAANLERTAAAIPLK